MPAPPSDLKAIGRIKDEMDDIREMNDSLETTLELSDSDESYSGDPLESEQQFEAASAALTDICGAIDSELSEETKRPDQLESGSSSSWFDAGVDDDRIERVVLLEAQLQHRTEQKQQADKHAQNLIDIATVHGHERSKWERERCALETQNTELLKAIECARSREAEMRQHIVAHKEKLEVARTALVRAQSAMRQYAVSGS